MTREQEFGVSLPLQIIDTLISLNSYGDFVETKLRKEVQIYDDLTEKHKAGDFFSRPKEMYGKDFVNLSRMSLLNSIYAFTEFMIKETCFNHAAFIGNKMNDEEFGKIIGKGVVRKAQNYLTNFDINHFEQYRTEFNLLDNCRLVRNKFAHNNGKSTGSEKFIKCIQKELGKDSIKVESGSIVLGEKICDEIIENNIKLANGIAEWAMALELIGTVSKKP